MVSLMGVFVNVNASEDQEMITSNQVLEDGFLEETEEEEFLNFSTKNSPWGQKNRRGDNPAGRTASPGRRATPPRRSRPPWESAARRSPLPQDRSPRCRSAC